MVRKEIKKLIERIVKELYEKEIDIRVEKTEPLFGDYSTNLAMILKKNPQEIAKNIKSAILEKIEVKGGFINFFLSKEYLQKQVAKILKQGEKFGKLNIGRGKKVNVEFISANPTGPLTIGNGRVAFFGDTLANLLERAGYKVIREYYINDAKVNTQIKTLGQTALGKGVTYLTPYLKSQISKLNHSLALSAKKRGWVVQPRPFEKGRGCDKARTQISKLSEAEAGYRLAQIIQKDIKVFIEKKLKIKFDNWVSEENLYKKNKVKKIYQWLKKKNLVYQKEGAQWLKISQFGAPKDEVIIRQTGEPTYFLSDIAYHKDKFERNFQKIINLWGADHQGHVPKIKAIAKILGFKGDLDILICQIIGLKGGIKISKRKGEIVTLEWLIDEIGLDPARFFYLMKSLDTQMEFDLELAKERSKKSPVYYVQYAYARLCSILRKCKRQKAKIKMKIQNAKLLEHPSELELIKCLIRFPEVIEDTVKDYQIQRLPQYAIDLATVFHQFYRDCKVLTENPSLKEARLGLVLATKIVLKNTLDLIGVSTPERM